MPNDSAHATPEGNTKRGGLAPNLAPERYVFCSLPNATYGDFAQTQPLACIAESEGLTLILTQDQADQEEFGYTGIFRCISLGLHSSLEAVGLTAKLSTALAHQGISANMFAGYYHDHLFVPAAHAERALNCLLQLNDSPRGNEA